MEEDDPLMQVTPPFPGVLVSSVVGGAAVCTELQLPECAVQTAATPLPLPLAATAVTLPLLPEPAPELVAPALPCSRDGCAALLDEEVKDRRCPEDALALPALVTCRGSAAELELIWPERVPRTGPVP